MDKKNLLNGKPYHYVALDALKKLKPGKLLELGIGNGRMLEQAQLLGYEVQGVDIDENFLSISKKKGFNVKKLDLNNSLPFKDGSFDYVMSFEVLEHIPNFKKTIQEINRVLKKGGKAILSTPNCGLWRYRFALLFTGNMPPEYDGAEGHVNHYSFNQWKKMLEKYFEVKSENTEVISRKLRLSTNFFSKYSFFVCEKP